ncbi:MAG: hypothetical protein RI911_699 [Candidatus Parcubacteria bacterium]|jgi:hypothetical protein
MYRRSRTRGFSLVEALISIAIMGMFITLFQGYSVILIAIKTVRNKLTQASIANERIEIIHNMPYDSVGIVSGVPAGIIPATEYITRAGNTYRVDTFVRNMDDPFDGTIDGIPDDTSPIDYKIAEVAITCTTCSGSPLISLTGRISPPGLESATTSGLLLVRAIDATGTPLSGATVRIVNSAVTPTIDITDVTDVNGELRQVGVPPSTNNYQITVSKSGYSTDQTLPIGATANPNPVKPHATITASNATQLSFAIDRTSALNVSTVTSSCSAISSFPFTLTGTKTIGSSPVVYKYNQPLTTDTSGLLALSSMEWDSYTITEASTAYTIAGTIPITPFLLNPNATQDVQIVLAPQVNRNLLVTILESGTGLPISGASVRLRKGGTYDQTKVTGVGSLTQTAWNGASGQATIGSLNRYFSSDGNIETNSPVGDMKLYRVSGSYVASGELTSSTFDLGAVSNFAQLQWLSASQPAQTGTDPVRFQIATNNDNATWDFKGPDGTDATYYTTPGATIHSGHNGHRYIRYKVNLQTANAAHTPTISDVWFTYTTACTPPGQVLFTGTASGNHTLTVTKTGYTNHSSSVSMSANERQVTVTLSPE